MSGTSSKFGLRQRIGAVVGPLALIATWVLPAPEGMSAEAWMTAGVAALMATWWIAETMPIPATALLPLVLMPLLGLGDIKTVAAPYANPIVFLFLGGFLIAIAMERWELHRRIAFGLIGMLGLNPRGIVGGFLIAAAVLSMWVSNTATALMMLPIAISVLALLPKEQKDEPSQRAFKTALMLSIAYGATTGGMGSLIGTPPNALLAGFMDRVYGISIGFGQWMLIGVPVVLLALPVVYLMLTRVVFRLGNEPLPGVGDIIATERARMGRLSGAEAIVAVVFSLTALAWVTRPFLAGFIPGISDTTIALTGALSLFLIPAPGGGGRFLMNWSAAKAVPWEVLLLFGGGLCLASQIQVTGLAAWIGEQAVLLDAFPIILTLVVLSFGILLLTELTSNTATSATFLPVVAVVAVSLGQNPLLFVVPTALAANCAYMMPVGTPPNAIVFGSGEVTLPQMARAGILLNILLVPVILIVVWFLGPLVFGIEMNIVPDWAR